MNQAFSARGFFTVPDGTDVSPFLNATDVMQNDVPWGALGEMGLAAGRIPAGVHSWIHVHPIVVQVTYVVSGRLNIRMKDFDTAPYDLALTAGQAVVTRPGTLFQLRNDGNAPAEVLYIVSPPYIFEMTDGKVMYDDAVLVAPEWDDERVGQCDAAAFDGLVATARAGRVDAMRRIAACKGVSVEEPRTPLPP